MTIGVRATRLLRVPWACAARSAKELDKRPGLAPAPSRGVLGVRWTIQTRQVSQVELRRAGLPSRTQRTGSCRSLSCVTSWYSGSGKRTPYSLEMGGSGMLLRFSASSIMTCMRRHVSRCSHSKETCQAADSRLGTGAAHSGGSSETRSRAGCRPGRWPARRMDRVSSASASGRAEHGVEPTGLSAYMAYSCASTRISVT